MTTQETFKLANEITEKQALNIVSEWENNNDSKSIETYTILRRLGDSVQLACAMTIAEKENDKGCSEMYRIAYAS
jgi:hypothetical protein